MVVLTHSAERCDNCPPDTRGMAVAKRIDGVWYCGTLLGGTQIRLHHEPTSWTHLPNDPT